MTDDKFILMDMNDERSKKVAEVLGNKTCKKIIEYLAETKEASEKDIADALSIPINTAEYNLNKLIDSGLVEKTKNFFWSVKGKKIGMFKLAKKHIVISPRSRPNMEKLKSVLPVILIAAALISLIGLVFYESYAKKYEIPVNIPVTAVSSSDKIKQFNSVSEISEFLKKNIQGSQTGNYLDGAGMGMRKSAVGAPAPTAAAESAGDSGAGAGSYSKTNIQVEGVDEADIVKNDGKYIYTLSGNKITIVNAYPADEMKIESTINLTSPINMFVNGDKLIVFESSYSYVNSKIDASVRCLGYRCGGYSVEKTNVFVYNIENRKEPKLEMNFSFDGNYQDSRMIGNYVYLVNSKYIYAENPDLPVYSLNGVETSIGLKDIYYFDRPDTSYTFNTISAIGIKDGKVETKVYLVGGTGTIFVSQNNIYLTYLKQEDYNDYVKGYAEDIALKILPDSYKEKINSILGSDDSPYSKANKIKDMIYGYSSGLSGDEKAAFDKKFMELSEKYEHDFKKRSEKTAIHKIHVDKDKIEYSSAGYVSGHILNQFSMDEYKEHFRIATTTGDVWNGDSLNHLFVLDSDLKIVGSVEDLAEGEKIYSARFMGDRAYIVTFKKVDPLFVIDVSKPKNPKVLGYLKIPGYSDYLHPYDENHVIGIGKDAVDASEQDKSGRGLDFAWYQGMKVSLFDVTDVEHPIEKSKFNIGDRGTDSPALYDHKAILFDKDKKILAFPVSLAEIDRTKYHVCNESEKNSQYSYNYCLTPTTYGETKWNGVYVLNIDLDGISLRGRISHQEEYTGEKYGAARDEAIGATRKDQSNNIWTKISKDNYGNGQWKNKGQTYEYTFSDWNVDTFPGGVNYQVVDYTKQIQRSLFMDDVLYTVSQAKIKANDLNNLNELNSIDLKYNMQYYSYGEGRGV